MIVFFYKKFNLEYTIAVVSLSSPQGRVTLSFFLLYRYFLEGWPQAKPSLFGLIGSVRVPVLICRADTSLMGTQIVLYRVVHKPAVGARGDSQYLFKYYDLNWLPRTWLSLSTLIMILPFRCPGPNNFNCLAADHYLYTHIWLIYLAKIKARIATGNSPATTN